MLQGEQDKRPCRIVIVDLVIDPAVVFVGFCGLSDLCVGLRCGCGCVVGVAWLLVASGP